MADPITFTWYLPNSETGVVAAVVGPPGAGVPLGGTTGQYLRKASSTNYDTAWDTVTSGDISGLDAQLAAKEATANKGVAGGYASLDGSGLIPTAQLPALAITETFVVASQAAMLALTAQQGDVAVRSDLNKSFILATNSPTTLADWKELLTPTDAVLSVAGKTGVVTLVKADVGLGNVDNTSDASKPVSTAQQTALDLKANLASPALTGSPTAPTKTAGDNSTKLATTAYADTADATVASAASSALAAHTGNVSNPHAVTKTQVGLGNVDNTSDAAKPISTATQTALDAKQPLDADLTAIGALVSAADKVAYATGAQAWALTDFTTVGRTLVGAVDQPAQRTALGLGTAAVQNLASMAAMTMAGVLLVVAGTVALPGIAIAGDTDTGIYAPAANTLALVVGGAEGLRVATGETTVIGNLVTRNGTTATGQYAANTWTDASNNETLASEWSGSVAYLRTKAIGTGVQRGLKIDGATFTVQTAGSDRWAVGATGHTVPTVTNTLDLGSASFVFRSVYAGTSFLAPLGVVGTPSYSFNGDTDTGFWSPAANTVALSLSGAELIRWAAGEITVTSAGFTMTGNISAPAWGVNGLRHKSVPATLTDTTSSGTVAAAYTNAFGGNTIAATSATVFTDYATAHFNAPTAGTNVTFTSAWAMSLGGALRSTGQSLSGSQSQSLFDLATTWNTSGNPTVLKLNVTNTASGATAKLADLQTGGTSQWNVGLTGITTQLGSSLVPLGTTSLPSYSFAGDTDTGLWSPAANTWAISAGGTEVIRGVAATTTITGALNASGTITSTTGNIIATGGVLRALTDSGPQFTLGASSDVVLTRGAADVLELRRTTNAQTLRVYNTYTDASNYERGVFDWSTTSNVLSIGTAKAGTGSTRAINILVGGTAAWSFNTSGHFFGGADNTYDIGASGASRPRFVYAANNFVTGGSFIGSSAGTLTFGARGLIRSPADGEFSLNNNAETTTVRLVVEASNTLALRNSTSAQTMRWYETYTDASNYGRLSASVVSNVWTLQTEAAGTGTVRDLKLSAVNSTITLANGAPAAGGVYVTRSTSSINSPAFGVQGTFSASSGVQPGIGIQPTINQSSTAGYTALLVNVTETAIGSGANLLWDAQVGGVSKGSLTRLGVLTASAAMIAPYVQTTATTVAGLPAAATAGAGARAYVTDAMAPAYGVAVAGGGAAKTAVNSDGAVWYVG